jgi:ankyrin repeat protein
MDEHGNQTPLTDAIDSGQLEAAKFLLSHGADPNLARALISAINVESEDLALDFVKLLAPNGICGGGA